MKVIYKIFGLILGLVIFTSLVWQTLVIVHFYVNQTELEAAYCINKQRPELNCHGQCHLKETLNQAAPSFQKQASSIPSLRTALIVLQFQSSTNEVEFNNFAEKEQPHFDPIVKKKQTYHPSIFHPPRQLQEV